MKARLGYLVSTALFSAMMLASALARERTTATLEMYRQGPYESSSHSHETTW